ncbi:MAG: hypothetical protein WBM68_14000, partial [Woeseia sp.]
MKRKTNEWLLIGMRVLVPAALVLGLAGTPTTVDANGKSHSTWSTPQPVENVAGGCPIESPNGLALYTAGGFDGTLDVWIYERERIRKPFGPRFKASPPVSLDNAGDFCPTPLTGGWLMFVSDRAGGCGKADIYLARYEPGSATNGTEAINLGCAPNGPNTGGQELSPSLVSNRDGVYLYYSTNGPAGDQDIYVSRMDWDGSFGPGEPVTELNTEFNDQQPNVRSDGREIVFSSDRDNAMSGTGQDVFTAVRTGSAKHWRRAKNLTTRLGFPTVDGN